MESSAIALREAKEGDKEKQIPNNEKSTEDAEDGDGGDDGSGGPGGGDRKAAKGPKILHKSSKEFYKAMAKQWGITCKMSDHCRCLDCQVYTCKDSHSRFSRDKFQTDFKSRKFELADNKTYGCRKKFFFRFHTKLREKERGKLKVE